MKVTLGTLKGKGEELATFLEPRVGAKPTLSGDTIDIEDGSMKAGVHPRQVKTYIKRFLYMNGVRKNYRVFVAGKELTIQEIELGEEEEKEGKKETQAPAGEQKVEAAEEEVVEEVAKEPKPEKPKKTAAKKPRAKKKKGDT